MADTDPPNTRTRGRLEDELALLRARRSELTASLADRDAVGDRADESVVLEQADDVAWLDDRIAEISRWLVTGGPPDPEPGELPHGTVATVRFDDGEVTALRVVAIPEEIGDDEDVGALTPSSPLGRALVGSRVGETIEYETPAGVALVEVLALEPPPT